MQLQRELLKLICVVTCFCIQDASLRRTESGESEDGLGHSSSSENEAFDEQVRDFDELIFFFKLCRRFV
jgi:hypothetical protein